jgi:hypothetical protein
MPRPASRVGAVLEELCVSLGYCLPGEAAEELLSDPPDHADVFADRVFLADGLDPELIDRRVRAEVVGVISDWLFDASGKGREVGASSAPAQGSLLNAGPLL